MRTLLPDPPPAELEELLERRRRLRLDQRDEVWDGVLHVNPPPSYKHERIASSLHRLLGPFADAAGFELVGMVGVGVKNDNRVPDLALQRPEDAQPQWQQTAALAVEIISPGDETMDKLPFYAAHDVDELLIVDPQTRSVQWLRLTDGSYEPAEHSSLIDLGPAQLAQRIDWP
ncbi:MAG: Uma2 family endonuclease [Solirubrobacteraceae bacterium]